MMTLEEKYMREAIRLAKKAAKLKEVPIGCVIVHDGKIIGRGYNRRTIYKNVLAHAEIVAIRKACKAMGDWRLEECTMYVTLEPCPMCAGACIQTHIGRIVFGAWDAKLGACGSVWDIPRDPHIGHMPEVYGGVLEEQCAEVLHEFFSKRR